MEFNVAMRELRTGFRIRKAAADKTEKWLSVSFNGTEAIRAMRSAAIILNQAFPDSASACDQAFKRRFTALFEAWQDLAEICLAR
eukprot:3260697-Rhodomonas_salina.1